MRPLYLHVCTVCAKVSHSCLVFSSTPHHFAVPHLFHLPVPRPYLVIVCTYNSISALGKCVGLGTILGIVGKVCCLNIIALHIIIGR